MLYHHGIPQQRNLLTAQRREWLDAQPLSHAAREQVTIALSVIDALDHKLAPFDKELRAYARKQLELGDTRRFPNSRDVVRYPGLDITVHQSDAHRAPGHLSRQGPPALRWALYEAAQPARSPATPDRAYDEQHAARIGGNRACLALARKLLKRSHHLLKPLGDQALQPAA